MDSDPRPSGLHPRGGAHAMTTNADSGLEPGGVGVARMPTVVDRITVALIPKAGEDLQRLQDRTSLSKTDIVNRAITLYEFIDDQMRAARDILIRDNETGETQVVRLL
jgi:hypothetical protein